jgi:hypothetical protein
MWIEEGAMKRLYHLKSAKGLVFFTYGMAVHTRPSTCRINISENQ